MKTRFLGSSGVRVSELCVGAMTFGGKGCWTGFGQVQQKEADELVSKAIEGSINFFDTADVHLEGLSEQILGKALGSRRKDVVLATKVRGRTGPGPNDVGLSRRHIIGSCNASQSRYIGASNFAGWQLMKALAISER